MPKSSPIRPLLAALLLSGSALSALPASALPRPAAPKPATVSVVSGRAPRTGWGRTPLLLLTLPASLRGVSASYTWDLPLPAVAPAPAQAAREAAPPADGLSADEREFVARVNAERAARGLCVLSVDPLLVRTARAHSREMCALDYFDHHSPTPGLSSPMDRYLSTLKDIGADTPDYLLVGENIYYCSVCDDIYNVGYGHRALMNSPGHRANILEPRFTKVGLGVYRNAKGEFWVTQMFTRDRTP